MAISENRTMREAYGKYLVELARENEDVVVLDADMIESCGLQYFHEALPRRLFNAGIAEQNMMGIAAGLAAYGKIPFVNSFACFLSTRSCDQLRVAVAYTGLNVKIVGGHGGISVGMDGATHQALEDIAIMRAIPNMTVIVPADAVETIKAVQASVNYVGPVYIRLARPKVRPVFGEDYSFQIGKAVTLRDGKDATIMAIGIMVAEAIEAAELLHEDHGLDVRVLNVSTIKPIDKAKIVQAAEETGGIVTVEDHSIIGGLGGAVAEVLVENKPVPMRRIGIPDTFGESGTTEELLAKYGLTSVNIASVVMQTVRKH